MFSVIGKAEQDRIFIRAQQHASDIVKRRWPNRYVGCPFVDFRQCFACLVEMGAIKIDAGTEQTRAEKKLSLINWFLNRQIEQARTVHNIERGHPFYRSGAWRKLRFSVLAEQGGRCKLCGANSSDGARLHVDHIKPRSKYPELSLDPANMQVLCEDCNLGKSDTDL